MGGKQLRLRALNPADIPTRTLWTADKELMAAMGVKGIDEPPASPEDELRDSLQWLQTRLHAGDRLYAMEVDGRYIGDIDVEFFPEAGKAEMTVMIGDPDSRGKGFGTQSVRLSRGASFGGSEDG